MSTREMAVELISSLSEGQVKNLVEFVKGFYGNDVQEKAAEQEKAAKEKELEEKSKAFERLDRLVRENSHYVSDIGDNDKEMLYQALMEKYGEGL